MRPRYERSYDWTQPIYVPDDEPVNDFVRTPEEIERLAECDRKLAEYYAEQSGRVG